MAGVQRTRRFGACDVTALSTENGQTVYSVSDSLVDNVGPDTWRRIARDAVAAAAFLDSIVPSDNQHPDGWTDAYAHETPALTHGGRSTTE